MALGLREQHLEIRGATIPTLLPFLKKIPPINSNLVLVESPGYIGAHLWPKLLLLQCCLMTRNARLALGYCQLPFAEDVCGADDPWRV